MEAQQLVTSHILEIYKIPLEKVRFSCKRFGATPTWMLNKFQQGLGLGDADYQLDLLDLFCIRIFARH